MVKTKSGLVVSSVVIIGRRWFQKTYGNTYFTADILVNGERVHTLPKEYGYGDQYAHTAMDWLEKYGYLRRKHYENGGHEGIWQTAERLNVKITLSVSDVARERDL